MLHNEARKRVLEAWDKTHNAREIAKYFSVNESTVYRLIEERARTDSYYIWCKCRTSNISR